MYDHPRIIQGTIQTFLMLFFLTTGAKAGTSDFEFSSCSRFCVSTQLNWAFSFSHYMFFIFILLFFFC
jgi:hypothetical protein